MLTMRRFDENCLVLKLKELPRELRVAFAAACAQRQLPAYEAFHQETGEGDPAALAGMLERVWQDLSGRPMATDDLRSMIDRCMVLTPSEEAVDHWTDHHAYAEDASASVAYALRTRLTGEAQEAAWAARRAYESLDQYVIRQLGIDVNEPRAEDRIVGHPLIQKELEREERDLEELATGPDRSSAPDVLVAALRARAEEEGTHFFNH